MTSFSPHRSTANKHSDVAASFIQLLSSVKPMHCRGGDGHANSIGQLSFTITSSDPHSATALLQTRIASISIQGSSVVIPRQSSHSGSVALIESEHSVHSGSLPISTQVGVSPPSQTADIPAGHTHSEASQSSHCTLILQSRTAS